MDSLSTLLVTLVFVALLFRGVIGYVSDFFGLLSYFRWKLRRRLTVPRPQRIRKPYNELPAIRVHSSDPDLPTVPVDVERYIRDVDAQCSQKENGLFKLIPGDEWRQARALIIDVRTTRIPYLLCEQAEMYEDEHVDLGDNYASMSRAIAAHVGIYAEIQERLGRDHMLPMTVRVVNVIAILQKLRREHPVHSSPLARKVLSSLQPDAFEDPSTEFVFSERNTTPPVTVHRRQAPGGPSNLRAGSLPALPEMTVRQRRREDKQ